MKIEKVTSVTSSGFLQTDENDVLGIITLEDILEELLQEPIYDESELKMEVLKSLHISMKSPGNIAASQRGGEDMASSWASRSQRVVRQPMFVRQSSTGKIATPTSKTPVIIQIFNFNKTSLKETVFKSKVWLLMLAKISLCR